MGPGLPSLSPAGLNPSAFFRMSYVPECYCAEGSDVPLKGEKGANTDLVRDGSRSRSAADGDGRHP
jgi:hypothetical protein